MISEATKNEAAALFMSAPQVSRKRLIEGFKKVCNRPAGFYPEYEQAERERRAIAWLRAHS